MNAQPTIAVLLACHNRRAKTLACLELVAAQKTAAKVETFLYDDGSTDGTADAVRRSFPDTRILQGTGQAFWAGGMRAAFDHALALDFDHYLWLNDDVVLDPDAVARLLSVLDEAETAGQGPLLVGGAVRDPGAGTISYGGIVKRPSSRNPLRFVPALPFPALPRPCDTLNGNVVLIPRRTAQAVGSIGGTYRHSLGDLDYGLRVRRAGGTVLLAPGAVGLCARNPGALSFFDPATPLRRRWRQLADPLGFPLRPWLHFARAHGGPFWPIFAILPFRRLLIPAVFRAPRPHPGARGSHVT